MSEPALPFSHTLARPGSLLSDHLERVAARVERSLRAAGPRWALWGRVTGLCHDLGKASALFQDYLGGRRPKSRETQHSVTGALWALWLTQRWGASERGAIAAAILRHHGSLRSSPHGEVQGLRDDRSLPELWTTQLRRTDLQGVGAFLLSSLRGRGLLLPAGPPQGPEELLASLPRTLRWRRARPEPQVPRALLFTALYGSLVAADRVDSALAEAAPARVFLPGDLVQRYRREVFGPPKDELGRLRAGLARSVERHWLERPEQRLFTLTSPTGSGKTLAVLGAQAVARPGRVVYALPFTSVIDQNAEVFTEVLRHGGLAASSDQLLVHHHLSESRFTTQGGDEYSAGDEGRLLTETWQSELVVTTFHQLLHALLSRRRGSLLRAAVLPGATVILDEVQALPLRYWRALRELLVAQAEALGTTFVLMTATRPLIFEPGDAVELFPEHEAAFRAMSRVELELAHLEPSSLEQLAEAIVADGAHSVMVILNTRNAVRRVYELLEGRSGGTAGERPALYALSTSLRPLDRRARIQEIKDRLEAGQPTVLVSTQLVEAGVCLSFPVVHRDRAPLDCVIQAAGRCNRNAERAQGRLRLWRLVDEKGREFARWVYDALLLEATDEALAAYGEGRDAAIAGDSPGKADSEAPSGAERDRIPESGFLELSQRYFEACTDRGAESRVDQLLAAGRYEELEQEFQLIRELPRRSFYVALSEEDEELWARYQRWLDAGARPRAFAEWERAFFERVVQLPGRADGERICKVGSERYDEALGLSSTKTELV